MNKLIIFLIVSILLVSQAMAIPDAIRCQEDAAPGFRTVHNFRFKKQEGLTAKLVTLTIDSVPKDTTLATKRTLDFSAQGTEKAEDEDYVKLSSSGYMIYDSARSEMVYKISGRSEKTVTNCQRIRPGGGTGN